MDIFSEKLRLLMDCNDVSQHVLADALGLSQVAIHKYLHGSMPRADRIAAIEAFFHVPPGYFFSDAATETPAPPIATREDASDCDAGHDDILAEIEDMEAELARANAELARANAEMSRRLSALRARLRVRRASGPA